MVTISLCMIVKNEEEVLARCLDSVRDAVDEIVVIDTGSTDRTLRIARSYTSLVYEFEWIEDFSAARNFSFSKASMDYCMWLDADDILTKEDCESLRRLKETLDPSTNVVMMKYNIAFDEAGKPTFSYNRERLIRREAGLSWAGTVHESIAPIQPIFYSDMAITHKKLHAGDPDRNLRIYENMQKNGVSLSPRDQYYYARELSYHDRYEEAAAMLERFLDEGLGWIENNLEACRLLSQCYEKLGRGDEALRALLRALTYAPPRGEHCCDIGAHFFERGDYRTAVFWYELALSRPQDPQSGGFCQPEYYDYIPSLQLCVCWSRLGDQQKAEVYNDLAGSRNPQSKAYLYNQAYFEKLRAETET